MRAGLISLVAASAIILATAGPALASSTINISSNSNSNSSFNGFGSGFPFVDINFDQFFNRVFGHNLKASMDGKQEIPGPGDADGTGQATIRLKENQNQICVDMNAKYLDTPTMAHIHHAPAGSAGAIVVVLPKPDESGNANGCVDVDSSLIKAIKDNPQDYYVNVHTNTYPDGAIRGQLAR